MDLPLSPQVFDLLVALSHGPQHGYALMQRIAGMHGNRYKPSPGVVYSNLQRIVDWGWAVEAPPPEHGADARRKYFRITAQGLELARTHSANEQARLNHAQAVLGGVR